MKLTNVFFITLCLLTTFFTNAQLREIAFKKGDRICFVGNSITHNGGFHHNILQYYVTRFPKQPVSFFNAGIKGDVTGGMLQRIEHDVLIHRPTHVVVMAGMNDVQRHLYGSAITQNADTIARRKNALELYRRNMDSMIRLLIQKGIKVILQKPSPYDETSTINAPNGRGINDALGECADVIQGLADQYKLVTVDYWTLMTNITRQMQERSPAATLTVNDRVHPNSAGHMIMAYQFLKSTNASSTASKIVLDPKHLNNLSGNRNCTVKKATWRNNSLNATVLENALPFPVDDVQQPAMALVPFMQELNNQLFQVKNLPKGNYTLLIDGTVTDDFPHDALQKGVNLASYKQTPQYRQALEVRKSLHLLWEIEATSRSIKFVEYMHLNEFSKKGGMEAARIYLDSIYTARFKGQQYYATSFEKYIQYKPQQQKLLRQSDSLRAVIYRQAQPVPHLFTLKKANGPTVNALIEASQSGAMPLLFEVQPKFEVRNIDTFQSDREHYIRAGLPNFFNKLSQKKPSIRIAFLGGSITKAEDQYRNQTLALIQSLNPGATLKGINAGVSGTGTELGACRVREQVLQYNPDLVFVEFAVNGGSNQAMEGIVRQIIAHNPTTDICFIYTIAGDQYLQYARNEVPSKIQGFEKIAAHYQIPSVHLGLYPSLLEARGQLVWKSGAGEGGKIVFSKDGTHPAKAGGDLYAQAIARAFTVFKAVSGNRHHELITPLYADNWEDAGMYAPAEAAAFSKGWETVYPATEPHLKIFAPWFSTVSKTAEAHAGCVFRFSGTVFGFFDIGGPEAGQVLVEIDGSCIELTRKAGNAAKTPDKSGPECLVNRFNINCNNRYRGQFELFEVPDGVHEVKITLSPVQADKAAILQGQDISDIRQNPDKYNRQVFYLGRLLIKGKILQ